MLSMIWADIDWLVHLSIETPTSPPHAPRAKVE